MSKTQGTETTEALAERIVRSACDVGPMISTHDAGGYTNVAALIEQDRRSAVEDALRGVLKVVTNGISDRRLASKQAAVHDDTKRVLLEQADALEMVRDYLLSALTPTADPEAKGK